MPNHWVHSPVLLLQGLLLSVVLDLLFRSDGCIVPIQQIEYGVYGDLIIIYLKPYSIHLRGTIALQLRLLAAQRSQLNSYVPEHTQRFRVDMTYLHLSLKGPRTQIIGFGVPNTISIIKLGLSNPFLWVLGPLGFASNPNMSPVSPDIGLWLPTAIVL